MRAAILIVALAACGAPAEESLDGGVATDGAATPVSRFADVVHDAPGATGRGFGDPAHAVNGVRGGGTENGSVDVYSLGYQAGVNDSITLAWSDGIVANGEGDDLAVFENPFATASGPFMDLVIVEVSRDAIAWYPLAHDYATADETVYVRDPEAWPGFAGRMPVLLNEDTNPVDPFNRAAAGGDGLDLDDVVGSDEIRADGARYVRVVAAPARVNPDTGAPYVHEEIGNGADLDGVYGRVVPDELD